MLNTHRTPVRLYQSSDTGAPQLANAKGSFKTVLKACLINGYGEGNARKDSLGWAMPFEDDFVCVFQSTDPTSHRYFLRVDNTGNTFVRLHPYTQMNAINQGEGYFGYHQHNNYDRFGYINSDPVRWWLIGHGKAFVFVVSDRDNRSQMFYFGDVPSVLAGDSGNCVYLSNTYSTDYLYMTNTLLHHDKDNGGTVTCFAKKWNQTDGRSLARLKSMAYSYYSNQPEYPDRITGGFVAAESYILEEDNNKFYLRALLSGVLTVQNDFRGVPEGQVFTLDGDSDRYLKFSFGEYYGYLINISAWESQ